MGKRYLVEGAKLWCLWGSKSSNLLVPVSHGYTAKGKKKAINTDSKPETNIPNFGGCLVNIEDGVCKDYMQLASIWENTGGSSWGLEKLKDRTTLTMDSVLLCKRGGIIVPETSGQGDIQKINWKKYVKRYGSQLSEMMGANGMCFYAFDPINLNTGNFLYDKEDLVIHGITKLSFHMTYNSLEEFQGGSIGEGWHHNYEISIQCSENGILWLCLGDGQRIAFRKGVGTVFVPVSGNEGLLKQEADGYRYVTGKGLEYFFDSAGRIVSRKDKNGNTDTFLYNTDGMLAEVQGANGGALYYYYNSEKNLYRVCDHTGREVRLWYSYRVLQSFVNSSGQTYTYGYNENLRLESVTTPRGIVGVRNSYDSANRVIKQMTPDGGVVELRYDDEDQLTYAKDQKGHITSYLSDHRFRNVETSYQDGTEKFQYNENNQITFYEDQNGNQTQYQYDDKGNLTGVTNALGGQQNFSYDKNGKLTTYAIDGKEVFKNEYDQDGHLVKVTDALGRMRQTIYDKKGMPKQIIMPDGSSIRIWRDKRGNICRLIFPDDTAIRYRYDALNRVVETLDQEKNKIYYQYDARDNLKSVINQEGAVRKYSYDESGRLIKIEDFDGGVFAISYDSMGRPEKLTDKEGRETKRSYDLAGNLIEEIFPIGAVNVYEYDRKNRLTRAKRMAVGQDEADAVMDYTYDPVGNLLKVEAGDGTEVITGTSYEYDALNRIIAIIDPVGGRKVCTYDRRSGKVSSITDAAGNKSTYHYNAAGELIEKTDMKGNTTRYEYNELGKIISVTDGAGRTTRYRYLPGGRLEQISYPDGRQMRYLYDCMGRVQKKTDGLGYSLSYTYDSMGRVLRIMGDDGQEKSYSYDVMGNVTAVTDALGNKTEYVYTLSGKLKEVKDALGNKTEFAYDAADRLIHICQHGQPGEEDRVTDYERNIFGQVECVRDAVGAEELFHYDVLGRMTEKIDRDGSRTVYTYTADGKTESIRYDDGNVVEFQYNPLRQLTLIRDWLGETHIERNCYGEPMSVTDHEGRTVRYEWGDMGERKKLVYPDGSVVSMHYDKLLHLVELNRTAEGKNALRINYRYDSLGRLSEKYSNGGYHTAFSYNEAGQVKELSHEDAAGIIDRYCYEYDVMGNKTSIWKERRNLPEESGRYSYVYDALQRLTSVSKDGKKLRSYDYDAFGNRIGMRDYEQGIRSRLTYNVLNRLSEEKKWWNLDIDSEDKEADFCINYDYDRRGNLTGEYQGEKLRHRYAYNTMNRLARAWNGDGQETVYSYSGLGHRTGKVRNGDKESYLLDLTKGYNNLLCIENGRQNQKFYWDSGVAAMDEEGRKSRYYLPDELGSPLRVLSDTGFGDSYRYDEFGKDIYSAEQQDASVKRYSKQGEGQPFGYTGYQYDEISGTYFAQAREYQPESGRFTAEDLIKGNSAYPETLNRYGYCWNNPMRYKDTDGMKPEETKSENTSSDAKSNSSGLLTGIYIDMPEPTPDIYVIVPKDAIPSTGEKITRPSTGEYITTPDPDAVYYTYDKEKVPVEGTLQVGVGLYGKVDVDGLGGEIGGKMYYEISSHNFVFTRNGGEIGAGLGCWLFGVSAGARREICPMLDNQVMENGWFFEPSLLKFSKTDGDYILSFGAGIFVFLGAEVDVDINVNECLRRIKDYFSTIKDYFSTIKGGDCC